MVTLKVHTDAFKKLEGQKVRIPVGAFVAGGSIMYYALRNDRSPSQQGHNEKAPQLLEEFGALAGFFTSLTTLNQRWQF